MKKDNLNERVLILAPIGQDACIMADAARAARI